MTSGDITGLILSYIYAPALLILGEVLARVFKVPHFITRKIIHIGAGLWVWAILYFFDTWWIGIIPFATFILLNYVFFRLRLFQGMDGEDATLGTVYFAISITILFGLMWRTGGSPDYVPAAVAGVMAMTLGDAAASLIGKAWGRRTYTFFGHTRTWEGTAAMAAVTFIAIYGTLTVLPGSALSPHSVPISGMMALVMSGVGTLIASAAEAVSPAGTDNLSVPLLTGLALWGMLLVR
jgi:phytol kinase